MHDPSSEAIFRDALNLPHGQRFALVDAMIERDAAVQGLHGASAPLTEERLAELVAEGQRDLAEGKSLAFERPEDLSDHVAGLFRKARGKTGE